MQECGEFGFKLWSPESIDERGSHINFTHPNGYAIIQVAAPSSPLSVTLQIAIDIVMFFEDIELVLHQALSLSRFCVP